MKKPYSKFQSIYNTDFCLDPAEQTQVLRNGGDLPHDVQFAQGIAQKSSSYFLLAQNLPPKTKHHSDEKYSTTKKGRFQRQPQNSEQFLHHQSVLFSNSLLVFNDVLSDSQMKNSKFQKSYLHEFMTRNASTFDAIRPNFDSTGLFPYALKFRRPHIIKIRSSRISFKVHELSFPFECIDHLSLFLTMSRAQKCVSNILEISLVPSKENHWRPSSFHEIDWFISDDTETSLYAECVAFIRVPSTKAPFDLKPSRITASEMKIVSFYQGNFNPLNQGKHRLKSFKNGKIQEDKSQAVISFHVRDSFTEFFDLPNDFLCFSETTFLFEVLRKEMVKEFNPISSDFPLWNQKFFDWILFSHLAQQPKALQQMLDGKIQMTADRIFDLIHQFYFISFALPKQGYFSLAANPDTKDKAIARCGRSAAIGEIPSDERFSPFNTDEIVQRKNLCIWSDEEFKYL